MPRDETSVRLIAEQGLVEQLGYQIVEEEQKLRTESGATSAFSIKRHDDFGGELPRHRDIREAWVHRRHCILSARRIKLNSTRRQKLVQRLVLRRTACKTAG